MTWYEWIIVILCGIIFFSAFAALVEVFRQGEKDDTKPK